MSHNIRTGLSLLILAALIIFSGCGIWENHDSEDDTTASAADEKIIFKCEEYEDASTRMKFFVQELQKLNKTGSSLSSEQLATMKNYAGLLEVENANSFPLKTLEDQNVKIETDKLYARIRKSVVIVGAIFSCPDCGKYHKKVIASGFVIGANIIVTARHVIEKFKEKGITGVMSEDGRVFPIKELLCVSNKYDDIVVLKIDGGGDLPSLPIAHNASVGTPVYCISNPGMFEKKDIMGYYSFTQGIISGKFQLGSVGNKHWRVLTITADIAPGSSGGPVVNESGAVVGILSRTHTVSKQMTWKFVTPSSALLAILSEPEQNPAN